MKFIHYLLLFSMLALTACSSFEPDEERELSNAFTGAGQTTLAKLFSSRSFAVFPVEKYL